MKLKASGVIEPDFKIKEGKSKKKKDNNASDCGTTEGKNLIDSMSDASPLKASKGLKPNAKLRG